MMNDGMMNGMGWWKMGAMGLMGLLAIGFLVAGIVFFVRRSR